MHGGLPAAALLAWPDEECGQIFESVRPLNLGGIYSQDNLSVVFDQNSVGATPARADESLALQAPNPFSFRTDPGR